MKSRLVLFCLLFVAVSAQAEDFTVYEGTIGRDLQVVLELSYDSQAKLYKGRYFYKKNGIDIPLAGAHANLVEPGVMGSDGIRKPGALWQGKLHADIYSGVWINKENDRKLPFQLRRFASYDPDKKRPGAVEAITGAISPGVQSGVAYETPIASDTTPYEYRKVNVPMKKGKEISKGPLSYRLMTDPRTRFAYPRLTRHPNQAVMNKVNRILEQRHWHMMLEALSCAATVYDERHNPSSGSLGGYDQENISVNYLSQTLMTVIESGSTYCGGAHPNNHFDPYTLDLIKGEYLDFNRLFKVYAPEPKGNKAKRLEQEFSKEILRVIEKAGSECKNINSKCDSAKGEEDPCVNTLPNYLALYFREPDSLVLGISGIGHAMGCCLGDQITLPFKKLGPLLRPAARSYNIRARN
jgi:hypothetical protein